MRVDNTLHWDFPRILHDVGEGIQRAGDLVSVGVDTWGVDYGLLDTSGELLGLPVHYRDSRTAGAIERLTHLVPKHQVYARTGIQFLEINTLCQLFVQAARCELDGAERLLMMPDLIHHALCGSGVTEYTNATTTQCYDPRQGDWAFELLDRLNIPRRLFPEVVPPGTVLGKLGGSGTQVIAPATHDTGSAVAAMPLAKDGSMAFLSSGTWSLVGVEAREPVINVDALAANVTNEGGVAGTTRLLKNVMGLWLVQQARAAATQAGSEPLSYEALTQLASAAPGGTALIDPDDARFLRPGDLRANVAAYCADTGQTAPQDLGTLVRVLLESLAWKYSQVLEELQRLTGRELKAIHVVGGGARNELLCQLTADVTGLPVLAGAVEATAIVWPRRVVPPGSESTQSIPTRCCRTLGSGARAGGSSGRRRMASAPTSWRSTIVRGRRSK